MKLNVNEGMVNITLIHNIIVLLRIYVHTDVGRIHNCEGVYVPI